ncbi:unnamed protein product, partial [Hapterophycus canaliculatus]
MGVLSFGYAQLLHSATLATAYVLFAAKDVSRAKAAPTRAPPAPPQRRSQSVGPETEETEKSAPGRDEMVSVAEEARGFARVRGWLPSRPIQNRSDGSAEKESWVDRGKLGLAGALAGQSLLKHVLTEGDKIVLARATSL